MYILMFSLWLIFNGKITIEIVIFGLVFSAVLFHFIVRYMDYSIEKEKQTLFLGGYVLQYVMLLIIEILKANFSAIGFIFKRRHKARPFIFKFRTSLVTETARVVLANSITLTPGTLTVSLDKDIFTVHCLDVSLAEGMQNSVLVRQLRKMEEAIGR